MDMIEYFRGRLNQAEENLRKAQASGFRLVRYAGDGGTDITPQHLEFLRAEVEEYRRVLADLTTPPSGAV